MPLNEIHAGKVVRATVTLGASGRIVIPAAIREAMNLGTNEVLALTAENGILQIEPYLSVIRRVQREVSMYAKPDSYASDELIAERREEARREEEETQRQLASKREHFDPHSLVKARKLEDGQAGTGRIG